MNRQVVTVVPKKALPVRPSDIKPVMFEKKTVEVEEEVETLDSTTKMVMVKKEVDVEVSWGLDSDIARLIGEAKSLPKGKYLEISESPYLNLFSREIAWFAANKQVTLLRLQNVFYLRGKNKSK